MQGTNPLTMLCTYETPCGWCTKWDKECDKKPYKRGLRAQINPIVDDIGVDDTLIANKTCQSEEDHEWECCGISTADSDYRCRKCYAHKTVPYTTTVLESHFTNGIGER